MTWLVLIKLIIFKPKGAAVFWPLPLEAVGSPAHIFETTTLKHNFHSGLSLNEENVMA